MNIRNVLKTYSLLRTLSDDETALLNTLRSMNESERELLVSSLAPTPQKKVVKKSSKGASKSPRASSLQAQIQGRGSRSSDIPCAHRDGDGNHCMMPEQNGIHDPVMGYRDYHPFVSPSSAPRAAGKSSSANGSPSESNPSSKIEKEEAGVAASGGA